MAVKPSLLSFHSQEDPALMPIRVIKYEKGQIIILPIRIRNTYLKQYNKKQQKAFV